MPEHPGASVDPTLSLRCAEHLFDAFARYNQAFRKLTRDTAGAFARRDLQAVQASATRRIELYDHFIDDTVDSLTVMLGDRARDLDLWTGVKTAYQSAIGSLVDRELNKTFFNSLTRRFFGTVGVNRLIEFVNIHASPIERVAATRALIVLKGNDPDALAADLLAAVQQHLPLADPGGHRDPMVRSLERIQREVGLRGLELMDSVLYRQTRAFLVGRIHGDLAAQPLLLAFRHPPEGVKLDAMILDPAVISMLFGFTRSYFHVDVERVAEAVVYLRELMPHKPVSELYAVLGRAKQGKTERYREFFRHLKGSRDQFIVAPGSKGMVMAVFTLPSCDLVFKIIRDRFAYPKTVRRRDVLDNYALVFRHDRAGRLVDAQEFRRLRFPLRRFSEPVLEELRSEASRTVSFDESHVVIDHLYVERRLQPLNLYLRQAGSARAARAVDDYGQAIHDLAVSNIFPGDLLLKNFGVTRHGRVIFYDYDELVLVTDCRFRSLPPPRDEVEALSGEVWFDVRPSDIFPEQFESFLGLEPFLMARFKTRFGYLLTADWWNGVQQRLAAGEVIDWRTYPDPDVDGVVVAGDLATRRMA